ncbi:rod shape-determining protein MreC [Aureibaculum sp. 2210JD6-5]|uniref:rod shape-determining protein MreC n=1 Tax=Aureibaculum sp. 2210JD6-5 TaxID=3103957 RepID=UPI002AADDD0E|nr:rod shape-determining protein MreC [Aureibaculum sp. 2210JD6-5]MDY7395320.1 rod shape-determining protein MreC [Aureibaculum sp. 2210JD6-5]
MQQIVSFILKNKYFLLFLLLEIIAFTFTMQSHSYHKSKFVNSANAITGGIYNKINAFKEYTSLKEFNDQLMEENVRLKNLLSKIPTDSTSKTITVVDSVNYHQKYSYTPAKVIRNQYNRKFNFLTINVGSSDGVKPDQGVINSRGIIGITNSTSKNYATVLSILNETSNINVKLLNSFHFGSLDWDGKDYNILQLVDLAIQANIKVGDTIITGGKSTIFPEGIPVGTILDFRKENNTYREVNIKLFNDMSAIGPVNVITSFDKEEIENLEQGLSNE